MVHLIGHSLGGVLTLSAASLRPDIVSSVITLGAPFRGVRSHPMVLQMSKVVRERIRVARRDETRPACFTGYCDCDAVSALQIPCPHSIPHTAVYTKTDGIVDWRVCVNDDPATNVEVQSTHIGLVFNPWVYELIANRLAQPKSWET
jgi:pimeloyl-ACP methyl ester carboxylesterase